MNKKYRIRRYDDLNLVWEEYIPSKIIEQGFKKGEMSKERWKILGYFGRIEDLVSTIVSREFKLTSTIGRNFKKEVLAELERVKKEILANIEIDLSKPNGRKKKNA